MDVTQALGTAANIMLLGMVCVFVFLGLLVIGINVLAKIAGNYQVDQPVVSQGSQQSPVPAVPADVVAAISAAVHQYRAKRDRTNP